MPGVVASIADPLRYGDRRGDAAKRAFTLTIVVAAHIAVIALLLARHDVMPVEDGGSTLSVFDVAQAPPSPMMSPLPLPVPASAAPRRIIRPGGSSGRVASTAAPGAAGTAPAVDATTMPDAPPAAAAQIGIGTAIDLNGSGAAGIAGISQGLGNGQGGGIGDGGGNGRGNGGRNEGGGTNWLTADWIEKPSSAEWQRVWPADARRYGVSAKVDLVCIVPRPGPPKQCRVVREAPRGFGYGRAAMALSRLSTFRIKPVRADDQDRGDIELLVPVVFDVTTAPLRR